MLLLPDVFLFSGNIKDKETARMKVFVTGGAGHIGSHMVKALGEAGHDDLEFINPTAWKWEQAFASRKHLR